MTREYVGTELASPTHTFFAIGDHQNLRVEVAPNPLSAADLRFALNHHLLFSDRIFFIAEDMLVNEQLMTLLVNDYRPLLTDGLFVPLLRDQFDSIADCRSYLSAADYYNQTGDGIWRQYLRNLKNTRMSIGRFNADEAYAHFSSVARGYFGDGELLNRLGISMPPALIDHEMSLVLRTAGRTHWRRSALFRVADSAGRLGSPADAEAIRRLASVIYTSHYAGLFRQVGVYPQWYQQYIGSLLAMPLSCAEQSLDARVQLVAVLPHTRQQDIASLPLSDIYRLRATKEFAAYLAIVRDLAGPPERKQAAIMNALTRYLAVIDESVAERQAGTRVRARSMRRNLTLIRLASAAGAVMGLAEVAIDPATLTELLLAGTGVVMVALDRLADRRLNEIEQRRRTFWLDYCGNSGTFEAQVQRLRALPNTRSD